MQTIFFQFSEDSDWTDQVKVLPSVSSEPKLSQDPGDSPLLGDEDSLPQPEVRSQTTSDTLSQGSYNLDNQPAISSAPPLLSMQTGAFQFDQTADQGSGHSEDIDEVGGPVTSPRRSDMGLSESDRQVVTAAETGGRVRRQLIHDDDKRQHQQFSREVGISSYRSCDVVIYW